MKKSERCVISKIIQLLTRRHSLKQRSNDEYMQDEMKYHTDRKVNEKRQTVYITRSGRYY